MVGCLDVHSFALYVGGTGSLIWKNMTVSVFSVISNEKMSAAGKCLNRGLSGLGGLYTSLAVSLSWGVAESDIFHHQGVRN